MKLEECAAGQRVWVPGPNVLPPGWKGLNSGWILGICGSLVRVEFFNSDFKPVITAIIAPYYLALICTPEEPCARQRGFTCNACRTRDQIANLRARIDQSHTLLLTCDLDEFERVARSMHNDREILANVLKGVAERVTKP